jgi:predicted acetyltransferase
MCPWNQGIFRLTPNGGKLEIECLDDSAEPDVSLDALRLSEVIGGLTTALTLRSLGKIVCSAESAEKLEAMFPADSFVSYQRF